MKRIFRTRNYQPVADVDLDEELRSHVELKVEDLMARGMSEAEARVEALRGFDTRHQARALSKATAHTRARLRREELLEWGDALSRSVRYALRRMARSPGFTLVAILSLAIGIGANTAVFSVVNGLFLRPPPYEAPEELVQIWTGMAGQRPSSDTNWREFQSLLEVEDVFQGVGAYDGLLVRLRDGGGTRSAYAEGVTPKVFPLLGVRPALGRFFLPDESSTPGGNPVVVLGHRYWMQALRGDRGVLGGTVHLAGMPFTIVGVAPPELSALQSRTVTTDVFVPMSMAGPLSGRVGPDGLPLERPGSVRVLARLAPGVTREVAEARVSSIAGEIRGEEGRAAPDGWGFRLWPITNQAIDPTIDAGLVKVATFVMIVAGLVLLLACANLANLLRARALDRKRDMAVRLALGAGKKRLAGQLFTETLLLSALGGAGGFLLARWALALLFRFQPQMGVTLALDTSPDLRVLMFTLATVGLAGLFFGLIPALAVARSEITPVLKGGLFRKGRLGLRVGGGLVAFQMAVSIVLLTGSGLFLHSLLRARDTDPGFRPEGAVSVWVHLGRSGVPSAEWGVMKEEIARRAASEAGVGVLGVANALPLLDRNGEYVTIPGVDPPPGREQHWVTHYMVDHGYLEALGIPLLSGRGIQESDTEGTTGVVLVNQAAVRHYWPGESPLGKEILLASSGDRYRVTGVVGDVKVEWLGDPFEPALYFSMDQRPTPDLFLVARGSGGAENLLMSLRRAVMEVDPDLLIMQAQSLEDRVGVNLYPIRLGAVYLGVFGVLALILAAIGLYGVVSLSVSRRTREVGIRMSVGADAGNVVAMVLRGSLRSVVIGGIVGLGLSVGLATLVRSFLFGVEPADPATLVAVPLLLGSVAVVAAFLPARRASRVDPVEALRAE